LNAQKKKGLLQELLAAAMLKAFSNRFSEGYCITDLPTHIYRRSKHPKKLVSKMQSYIFSNGNPLLSSFSRATSAEKRSWPAYNLEIRSARPLQITFGPTNSKGNGEEKPNCRADNFTVTWILVLYNQYLGVSILWICGIWS
jgi:hypothetical protein